MASTVQVKHVVVHRTGQWWVVNTSPPSGTPTVYTVMEGTQSDADNLPNGGGVSGPYNSLAAANAVAAKEPPNATSGTGIPGLNVTPGGSFTGPLGGLAQAVAQIAGGITGFISAITDASLWRSLGWIVLGAVLLFMGFRLWLGKPALPSAPPVLPIPV